MARVWAPFRIRAIQNEFVPQINAVVDVLKERLLSNISEKAIESEVNAIREREGERLTSMPGTGDEDPAGSAEMAAKAGVSHFSLMHGIRQGMLNLFAASLYHTFEQQVMRFHCRNAPNIEEENDESLFKIPEFQRRLVEFGIDLNHLSSWAKIDGELRPLANAVKHADRLSARSLRQKRPELFKCPRLSIYISRSEGPRFPVFLPLVGDGLYVSLQDVEGYRDQLVQFWLELACRLERVQQMLTRFPQHTPHCSARRH